MPLEKKLRLSPLFALLLCPHLHAQKITSPKASFLDIPARRAFLQTTTDPHIRDAVAHLPSCIALPPIASPQGEMIIPPHYLHDSHGPTNPAEAAATRVYGDFARRVTAGMNRWVATGSEAEARCALDQMDQWAQAGALLNYTRQDSPQAWYQVEWTLSAIGISDSVLVNDSALDQTEQQRVTKWLDKAAREDISFESPNERQNNHHDWRALQATAIGITANDDNLFHFGVDAYKNAIGQIDKNGAFPLEMARHERSLHYQIFALDPLIMVAEFASRQGLDLYAYTAHGRTLRDAVVFFGRALGDPSVIRAYTPEDQDANFHGGDFAGIQYFVARFGPQGLPSTLLDPLSGSVSSLNMGGSATVLAAK